MNSYHLVPGRRELLYFTIGLDDRRAFFASRKPASTTLWFGKLWFGKLTNQTHQPHECGGMAETIFVALCGGRAAQRHKRRCFHSAEGNTPDSAMVEKAIAGFLHLYRSNWIRRGAVAPLVMRLIKAAKRSPGVIEPNTTGRIAPVQRGRFAGHP